MNLAGVPVQMADGEHQKISQACFENPAQHDILRQGLKIAGAAQRRTQFGLLHQGSIQNVALPDSFAASLASEFSGRIVERKLTPSELDSATALAQAKYATDAWMLKF